MGKVFYSGELHGKKVVINRSGIGKVSSTMSATAMIMMFKIKSLIFVGTAGAISSNANIGDIVVSTACVQHDFDARPFLPKCTVFSVGHMLINADQ